MRKHHRQLDANRFIQRASRYLEGLVASQLSTDLFPITAHSNRPAHRRIFRIIVGSLKSPRLWPHSNNFFVSAPKPLIFIYINPGVLLALRTGAGALS
jgi:hypothetical protein